MKNIMKKNKKGFTLAELLIAIAIFTIIGGIVSVFVFQGFTLYRNELESNADEGNLRNGMAHMINNMRKTPSEEISVSENVLTVDTNTYAFADDNILYNDQILVKGISSFSVTSDGKVIDISITTTEQRSLSTSYGLK